MTPGEGSEGKGAKAGLVSGSIGLASRLSSQLLLLLVTLVATRMLSVGEFGAYAIAAALLFLARNLLYVGAYEYLLKSSPQKSLASASLAVNLLVASSTMVVFALLSLAADPLFGTSQVGELLLILLPSVLLVALTSWYEALLLKDLGIRRYYIVTIVGEFLGAAAAIGSLFAGAGIFALVAQTYVRLGSMLLIYGIAGHNRQLQWPMKADMQDVLQWSGRRYLASLLNFGTNYGADLVLGVMLSPAATGLFRAAHRIVHALADLFVQPLLKIAQMHVSARIARGMGPGDGWLAMFTGVAAIGWAALAGLAAMAQELVPLVLGQHWGPAAPIVSILCAVRALSILDSVSTSVVVASDRQAFMLRMQIVATVTSLFAAVAAATCGPAWVAAATGFVSLGVTVSLAHDAQRLSGIGRQRMARAIGLAGIPALFVVVCVVATSIAVGPLATLPMLLGAGFLAGVLGLVVLRRPVTAALDAIGRSETVVEPA